MPELRTLRAFVALAEELNFTRAAARTFVTQPALSHQISRLEGELGLSLFSRSSRRVQLTPDGAQLLGLVRPLLNDLDSGLQRLRTKAAPPLLRVGFTDYVGHTRVPLALQQLRQALPGLELRQLEGSTLEQLEGLSSGQLDVGFFVANRVRARGVRQRRLWSEPLVLALPQRHPLAALERVPLAALQGQRLLLNSRESNPDMHAYLQQLFQEAGVRPHKVVQPGARMYSFAGIMRLIAEGEGVFLIVRSWHSVGFPGVSFRPLQDPEPSIPFRMAWRSSLPGPLLEALQAIFPAGR